VTAPRSTAAGYTQALTAKARDALPGVGRLARRAPRPERGGAAGYQV